MTAGNQEGTMIRSQVLEDVPGQDHGRARRRISWGIPAVDQRVGGLRKGGTYIVAGLPGSGRLIALLQFLSAGRDEGRLGLVTAASRRRVLEESDYWGLGLGKAWREGRLSLLSFKPDFQRRLLSAANPAEMLDEMTRLLGPDLQRLAIYPATPLWETRAGTSLSSLVAGWLEGLPATTLAAVGGDLESPSTPATDWMLDAATGVLLLSQDQGDRPHLRVRRMSPPVEDPGPITLDLVPGVGFTGPAGGPARRSTDDGQRDQKRVLLLKLAPEVPAEITGWLQRWYDPSILDSSRDVLERLGEERAGLVLVYTTRDRVDDALHAVRAIRGQSRTPVIIATGDRVRAGDRIRAVEAGASDFLSDPLSVGELASRAERAIIAGAPPRTEVQSSRAGPISLEGGIVDRFADRMLERLGHPRHSLFTLVRIETADPSDRERFLDAVAQEIRDEDGDLAGDLPEGVGVILQGTPVEGAEPFLHRVRDRLGQTSQGLKAQVMSGTADAKEIRALVPAELP